MKLSKLLKYAIEALGKYGDLEINAKYLPIDSYVPIYEDDRIISFDKNRNKLTLNVG